jgi:8-oxo-dGTP pyrophosphatase MutT (NUDIX family)
MNAAESTTEALIRELDEELGLSVSHIERAFFKDGFFEKLIPIGEVIPMYIIFLVFNCLVNVGPIHLNEAFSESKWVHP